MDRKVNFDDRLGRTETWLVPEKPLVYERVLRSRRTRCRRDRPLHWAVLGQHRLTRKIREWTTLDLIVNYTFNLPASAVTKQVAGYARDVGKNADMKDGKDKNVIPVSTAEYNPCGWRAWLNNTTITLGMNNVFDQDPPFVAGNIENGYDQWTANIRGRTWYVALTKRF